MGLYVRRDEERSKLQERIAAELRDKAKKSNMDLEPTTDMVEQSNYMDDSKSSSALLGVWLVIGLIGICLVVAIIVQST